MMSDLITSLQNDGAIIRVGVDVVDVQALERQISSDLGPAFLRAVFTASEAVDCRESADRYATRWAAKEAVAKAIGTGFRTGLRPIDIEIVTLQTGAIKVRSCGQHWPYHAEGWQWAVSASHEAGMAAAVAIAVTASTEEEFSCDPHR